MEKSLKFISAKYRRQCLYASIIGHLKLNYVLIAVFCYLSFSCQEKRSSGESESITYSIDSLIIDSKGRLLDLNGGMVNSDLDDQKTTFYLFNNFDQSIDEIDLEKREFIRSYPLEAEGANGVGKYIFGIQCLDDSLFFVKSNILSTVIDRNGQVVSRIGWDEAKDSSGVQFIPLPRYLELVAGKDNLKVFGVHFDFQKVEAFLDVLSVSDNTAKRFDIDS